MTTDRLTRGEIIRLARKRRVLSLRDVAAETQVHISTISRIENDKEAEWTAVASVALFLSVDLNRLARAETLLQESTR